MSENINPENTHDGVRLAHPIDDAPTLSRTEGNPEQPQEAAEGQQDDADTFPREYVEKLRKEAADNRAKAKRVDELAERLFRAEVAATGRLQDAGDLPFDMALLDDPDKLTEAIDELLTTHPHYARRRVQGSVGQGAGTTRPAVSLVDLLRGA